MVSVARSAAKDSSRILSASSTSLLPQLSGGAMRITLLWRPPRADEEAALLGLLEEAERRLGGRGAVLRRLVLHELERLHEALAAHVADGRGYFFLSASSPSRRTLPIAAAFRRASRRRSCRSSRWRRSREIGLPPKVEMLPPFHESAIGAVASVAADREAVGDPLGHRHDVRLDAVVVLDAPHLAAGAAEAGLHLVADEEAAVLLDDVDGDLELAVGRGDEPADAHGWARRGSRRSGPSSSSG